MFLSRWHRKTSFYFLLPALLELWDLWGALSAWPWKALHIPWGSTHPLYDALAWFWGTTPMYWKGQAMCILWVLGTISLQPDAASRAAQSWHSFLYQVIPLWVEMSGRGWRWKASFLLWDSVLPQGFSRNEYRPLRLESFLSALYNLPAEDFTA